MHISRLYLETCNCEIFTNETKTSSTFMYLEKHDITFLLFMVFIEYVIFNGNISDFYWFDIPCWKMNFELILVLWSLKKILLKEESCPSIFEFMVISLYRMEKGSLFRFYVIKPYVTEYSLSFALWKWMQPPHPSTKSIKNFDK